MTLLQEGVIYECGGTFVKPLIVTELDNGLCSRLEIHMDASGKQELRITSGSSCCGYKYALLPEIVAFETALVKNKAAMLLRMCEMANVYNATIDKIWKP